MRLFGIEDQSTQNIDATALKDDCLTTVYRLLFLFYAESRTDLNLAGAR